MSFNLGEKLSGGEGAADHVTFQLGHVDTIGSKTTKRLIERSRHIAYIEYERGYHRTHCRIGVNRLGSKNDEAGGVVGLVLNSGLNYIETVDLRR